MSLPRILIFGDTKYVAQEESPDTTQYYMHKEDKDILGEIRPCASEPDVISPNTTGCPAVWVLKEPRLKTEIDKYWQFYLCAINYGLQPKHVMAKLEYRRAFTNGTGFGDEGDKRRNWVTGEGVGEPNPQFDKDRTCSRSMLSGVERGGFLVVRTFDGNKPPPMKPGKRQPETLSEVKLEDYLYNPQEHWDLFFAANIIKISGVLSPFPNGATYPWFFGGRRPVVWFPHITRDDEILYPLSRLVKLPLGTQRIDPFTN